MQTISSKYENLESPNPDVFYGIPPRLPVTPEDIAMVRLPFRPGPGSGSIAPDSFVVFRLTAGQLKELREGAISSVSSSIEGVSQISISTTDALVGAIIVAINRIHGETSAVRQICTILNVSLYL